MKRKFIAVKVLWPGKMALFKMADAVVGDRGGSLKRKAGDSGKQTEE